MRVLYLGVLVSVTSSSVAWWPLISVMRLECGSRMLESMWGVQFGRVASCISSLLSGLDTVNRIRSNRVHSMDDVVTASLVVLHSNCVSFASAAFSGDHNRGGFRLTNTVGPLSNPLTFLV